MFEHLEKDLRLDLPTKLEHLDKLPPVLTHGMKIGWWYKEDEEYFVAYYGEKANRYLHQNPPFTGMIIATPDTDVRRDLDIDNCIVVVDSYPTEKCNPEVGYDTLGRLLESENLVRVIEI